jgi:type IV pilus assembly protein PilC
MTSLATQTAQNSDTPKGPVGETTQRTTLSPQRPRTVSTYGRTQNLKVKQNDLILFTTQLGVMLDSGVMLSDALDSMLEQTEQQALKFMIKNVVEEVKSGVSFSDALQNYPKVFNSMYISMIKASEASGKMVEMLKVLSDYLSFEMENRKRVKGALIYPLIMTLLAIMATVTLMFFVLPRFIKIYEAKEAALPWITQVLISVSNIMRNFQVMTVIMTFGILASVGIYYWAATKRGRRTIDFVKINTPLFGTMFTDMVVTRSMRIMATMVNTGVNLLETIEVISGSCRNYYFQRLWDRTREKVSDGYQLSESISVSPGSRLINRGIIQMLRAGEENGKLGEVCDKISVFYEKKFEVSVRNAMAMLEPLVLVILGGIIGVIAIALLLPVFRISSVIAH